MTAVRKSSDFTGANKINQMKFGLGDSWKDVIFIPFNPIIEWLFMAVTYVSVIYNIYLLTYKPGEISSIWHLILDIFCEIYYFFFMVLIILHRIIKLHRRKKYYKCHPIVLIIVDFISIVPITSVYAMINRFTWTKQFSDDQLMYNRCYLKFVRILRLFYFYFELRSNLTYSQKRIIILCHWLGSMLFIITLGSIYHYFGLYPPYETSNSWRDHYVNAETSFDIDYHLNWFILSTYQILGFYYNNVLDYINAENNTDLMILFIAMLLGFISQYIFLIGTLTSEELQFMRSKYILQFRLKSAKRLMTTLKMPVHLQKTVQSYYETIWNYRSGVVTMPAIVDKLSPYMQQEILTDIYWEALLHTKIFENVSSVFRRMVACQMKTEIYVPGHFVYKENDIKAKLVYLHDGMLEIYRMEKEDSRITVTSGTVLCELSCMYPYLGTANVKCITTCTLHVLYLTDFYKALRKYNAEFKSLRRSHRNRIKYAKNKLKVVKKGKMSHIKFVKTQWRNIIERPQTTFEPNFTSRFLDMITMTNIHIHPNAFCLKGSCPFVMKSNTNLDLTFYYLALGATIFNFLISYRTIIFQGGIHLSNYMLYALVDTILFINIYIQLITTVQTQTHIIEEPYEIFVYKLKNFYFILDLLSTIPIDYALIVTGFNEYHIGLARLNRFGHLYKVVIFFRFHEKRVTAYAGFLKICKFLVYHTFLCILLACAVYLTMCENSTCNPTSWISDLKKDFKAHFGYDIPVSNYLLTIYYTTNIYLKLLLRGYSQRYLPAIIARILIILISYYIITIKLAQICSTFGLRFENKHLFLEYVDMIEVYVHENKELRKYKDKLLECLSTEWMISGDLRYKDLSQVTYQESDFIRRNVNDEYILLILQKTPFFKKMPSDLLLQLAHNSDIFLIPNDHDLIKVGERCFYLYIVVEGHCISYSHVPGDHENHTVNYYNRFDVFPLLEYVHEIHSFLNVKSYTAVQLITIPYSVFSTCVSVFHMEAAILRRGCKAHMNQYWGLLKGTTISPFMKRPKVVDPDRAKPEVFTYKIKRQKLILDITNCSRQMAKDSGFMKYRKFLKWSTLNTYSPHSSNFMAYEAFRCICILIYINLIFFMCVPYIYDKVMYQIIAIIFCLLWITDMLIKAHLDYYNNYGILVTGFKATVKHYLKHSFCLDLLAGIPYDLFNIHGLAMEKKQFSLEIIILLNTRIFFLYRPWKYSSYLQGDGVTKFERLLKYFTTVIIIYFFIMYLAAMKMLLTCDIEENRNIICPPNSCLMQRSNYLSWGNEHLYWISVKSVLSTGDMLNYVTTNYDHMLTLILAVLMLSIRVGLLCKITGDNCIRQPRLVMHQNHLKVYNAYFANRLVSNSTKAEMLAHFKNIWQKSYSEYSNKIFENIYPYLRETLILTMYRKAVSKCILFQYNNEILFKLFIPYVEERYYKKDAEIIRINDVQGNIFIVVKGVVEVSVAKSKLCLIGPGAIFGCFEPLGLNRHTMEFKAEQHVNVLVIKATRFYQLIKGFKKVEQFMTQLRFAQFQYAIVHARQYSGGSSMISGDSGRSNLFIVQYPKLYIIYNYVTNVHMAPLSAFLVLIDCHIELGVMKLLAIWIMFDIYFCTCFFTRGKEATIDSTTGIEINQNLMKQYLTSLLVIFDFVTILPLYLIRIWWFTDYHQFIFLINKLLRIYYLYRYYAFFVKSKNVPQHLHRTMLVYCTLFLVQIIFVVWWFMHSFTYNEKTNVFFMLKGYIDVMNYISSLGIKDDETFPKIVAMDLLLEIFMVIMSTAFVITVVQMFTKSILSDNAHNCVFRFQAYFCRQFCIFSNVSKALVKHIWLYFYQLYIKQQGVQFPIVYKFAPRYLKQDHMQSLFGKHFEDHPLFFDMHVDLVKQIQTHIKCYFHLPGAVIVEKGLKNGRIYFIESGSVVAIQHTLEDNAGAAYEILESGNSFGEIQALLGLEHNRTYKALTEVELIFITICDWEYLLDWFPASKAKLFSRVNEHAEILKYT